MIYGYARVSSAGQAIDGNSLEAQSELLKANGAQKIFSDVYTGTKLHRPELDKLMAEIQPGDTLLVLGDETRGIVVTRPEVMRDVAAKIFDESDVS